MSAFARAGGEESRPPTRDRQVLSDVDAFRDRERVLYLDAKISHCAVELCVPEQQLYGAYVARLSVDERCFGAAKGMRAVGGRRKSYCGDPFVDEASILARGHWICPIDATWKQPIRRSQIPPPDPVRNSDTRLLGNFELDRRSSLSL